MRKTPQLNDYQSKDQKAKESNADQQNLKKRAEFKEIKI